MPTDPKYKELTQEQIILICEQYMQDHPELAKSGESFTDPTYDAKEKTLETDLSKRGETEINDPELPPVLI